MKKWYISKPKEATTCKMPLKTQDRRNEELKLDGML